VTESVENCLEEFKNSITVYRRDFDGDFSAHKNFLGSKCTGKYIFNIDADEIPQEFLIKEAEVFDKESGVDVIFVPRMNICPGYTQEFAKRWKFNINNAGWINWPDYQGRIYKNSPEVQWEGKVHEKINGKKTALFSTEPNALIAIWHIKDISRQNKQNELYEQLEESSPPIVNETDKDGSGQ
jgi:hypothetical protein